MPEKKIGTCPWCGRHNVELYLVVGNIPGMYAIAEFVCGRCKKAIAKWLDYILGATDDEGGREVGCG